jgi:hypothetical protein
LASVLLCLRGRVPRPGFEREGTTLSPANCRYPLARATFDDRPAEISMCRLPPPFFSLSSRSCPSSPPPLPNLPGVSSLGGRAAFALSSFMPNTPLLQAVGHPGQCAHISMRSALRSEGGEQVQQQISRESRGGLDRKSTMQVWHGCSNIRGGHHTLSFFYFLSSLSLVHPLKTPSRQVRVDEIAPMPHPRRGCFLFLSRPSPNTTSAAATPVIPKDRHTMR